MENVQFDVVDNKLIRRKMSFDEILKLEVAKIGVEEYHLEVVKALVTLKRSELIKRIRNLPYYNNREKEIKIDDKLVPSTEVDLTISRAIEETRGVIAVSGEKAVDLYCTKCCGGGTANSEDVLGYSINYLRKILCKLCEVVTYERVISVGEIAQKLNLTSNTSKNEIKGILTNVQRDETGRIINICVLGKPISGEEFAKLVGCKSTRLFFQENSITIKSAGEGLGLGICLTGADYLAKHGSGFKDIIQYYYTGVDFIVLDEKNAIGTISGKKILIDVGHGGSDVGNRLGEVLEKDVNLLIALEVEKKLLEIGVEVTLSRKEDINVASTDRVKLINEKRPELFISIHQNSFMFQSINGVEVYCYEKDTDAQKLGGCIEDYINKDLGIKNRGIKFGDYHLLRETKVSGIILECMYMSGDMDSKKYSPDNYIRLAECIFKGICKFYEIEQ